MIEVVSNDEWLSSQVSEESVSCIFGSCEAILYSVGDGILYVYIGSIHVLRSKNVKPHFGVERETREREEE
mgnify:CR=1 FL=1